MARKLVSEGVDSDSPIDCEESNGNDGETDAVGGLGRRNYMKLGAAAAGTILGASGLGSAAVERGGIRFDRVVNAVDDLGMDPTGSDPIDGALSDAYETGTLIEFPPGDYKVKTEAVISGSKSRWGIRGTGESHGDVTFHFPNADNAYWFVHQDGGEDVLLDNFTIDSDDKLVAVRVRTNDGSLIRDIEWAGFYPEQEENPGQMADFGTLDQDGVTRVVGTVMGRDGAFVHGHPWATGRVPMSMFRFYPNHAGETILKDIEIHQCGANGIRHTKGDGVVTIENSWTKNCHLAHIRVHRGNHPTKESTITNAEMIIDHDDALPIGDGQWHEAGTNCIMLDSTGAGSASAIFENCTVDVRNVKNSDGWGAVRCNNSGQSNPSGGEFHNCEVYNDTDLQTVWIDELDSQDVDEPHYWIFDGCHIELTSTDQYREAAFVLRDGWDGSVIRNSVIHAPNGDLDGMFIENCSDVTIEDTTIDVSGRATVLENADVTTTNVSYDASGDLDSSVGDGFEEDPSRLQIVAADDADAFEYSFTVDGRVEHATYGDYPSNPDVSSGDSIVENDDGTYTVEGVVAGYAGDDKRWGGDSYQFTGNFTAFSLNGPATVTIDGQTVDTANLVSADDGGDGTGDDSTSDGGTDSGTGDDGTEHMLRVIAADDADAFEYSFTVGGPVQHVTDGDYPSNPDVSSGDSIVENGDGTYTVEGVVAGYAGDDKRWGGDTYRFTGELLAFSKEGPADVLLNGDAIDPAEYTMEQDRTLRVIADDDADAFDYSFTVDGRVEHATDGDYPSNPDVSSGDSIVENGDGTYTVEGVVAGYAGDDKRWGGDSYQITGSIVSIGLEGPGTVIVDGETVDPAEYGLPNRLTIIGTGASSTFEFSVDGELKNDPNVSEDGDLVPGSSVEGTVTDGVRGFRFDGEISYFQFEGEAGVYLNGQQVEPTLLDTNEDPVLRNWIQLEGDGNETEYSFTASGHVRKSPDLGPVEAKDVIDGSAVEGVTNAEIDGYRFSGGLTSMNVKGSADLRFNGN